MFAAPSCRLPVIVLPTMLSAFVWMWSRVAGIGHLSPVLYQTFAVFPTRTNLHHPVQQLLFSLRTEVERCLNNVFEQKSDVFSPLPPPPPPFSLSVNTPQFMHCSQTRASGDGEVSVPQLVPLVEAQWPAPEHPSTASDLMVHHFMCVWGRHLKKYPNLLLFFI